MSGFFPTGKRLQVAEPKVAKPVQRTGPNLKVWSPCANGAEPHWENFPAFCNLILPCIHRMGKTPGPYKGNITFVELCNKADTEVGPALALSNQGCKPIIADLAKAAKKIDKVNKNNKSPLI